MKIADLYDMTFEEFHEFVVKNKDAARLLIGDQERFDTLKTVTRNNSRLKISCKVRPTPLI